MERNGKSIVLLEKTDFSVCLPQGDWGYPWGCFLKMTLLHLAFYIVVIIKWYLMSVNLVHNDE